jgi:hypothetical protein
MVRLHTKNQLQSLPGSAVKVCEVVVGGWWVESKFSDRLRLSFSLALAKPNNNCYSNIEFQSFEWACLQRTKKENVMK